MREQILAALARGDEAEAFGIIEPLDGTGWHYVLPLQKSCRDESGRDEAGHEESRVGNDCHYRRAA
jgi:hypothetical protein